MKNLKALLGLLCLLIGIGISVFALNAEKN